ncbi:MAG: Asp-tRNA(Asn)/Glu-tRNA(Gln) amidotransferase subunit GatC [Nanoarchaeota archaeon]|nr:Asp-tRNA(Asn)/Glu-tRNA(Gln) amidotransferase subunit GatC [Nanoarchaeota archaeon]
MDDTEFDRLLRICRLRLDKKERERIKKDVDEIIGYFNKIDDLNCDLEPAFHPIEIEGKMREDSVEKFDDQEALLKNTKTYRNFVLGPRI